jgi:hypothetical protein
VGQADTPEGHAPMQQLLKKVSAKDRCKKSTFRLGLLGPYTAVQIEEGDLQIMASHVVMTNGHRRGPTVPLKIGNPIGCSQ